ncbi:MAG: penicillin acylase family protein, partial [Pseudomonadota bacterium]
AARVADILPEYPSPAVLSVPRYGALFPGAHFGDATAPPSDPLTQALGPAARPELSGASNAWAVDASRSSSRHPLLASDPHLWLSAPGVWYLADLGAEGLSAIGGTLPGVPLVLIGHNTRLGWGLTTANVDDQDLFIEQLNPSDPNQYLTPLGWADFETRRVRIEVAGGEALVETVRATRHGPVLGEDMLGEGSVTPEGYVAALAWTALVEEDRSYSAALDLMRAESIEAAIEAAAGVVAPAQVLTLADESGVALHMAGRVPRRSPDSAARGRIPAPGWKSENDWQGFFPASAAPSVVSPEEGAVATANNRLSDAPFPRHISHDWAPPYRIRRLEKELAERRFHSRDSFQALQNDTVSEMARSVVPLIARDLWWREGQPAASGQRAEALALLAEWNGEMDRHSPEPLIFLEWMRWLTRRLALDELGGLLAQVSGPRPVFVERVFRDVDGAGIWCDIDKTPQIEPCSLAAEQALDDALTRLTRDYGSDIAGWRWGEAHSAIHRHMPFGFVPGLGLLFNIEHETSGSNHTLMRGAGEGGERDPFRNVHASGLRLVLDFADLDRSLGMISTGQSGHPFSQWYDHLADAWARGDAIALSRSMEEARSGSVGTLRVLPRATP